MGIYFGVCVCFVINSMFSFDTMEREGFVRK